MLNFGLEIKNLKFIVLLSVVQLLSVLPLLHAAQPDLEEQARRIAAELRCPVCQNLSAGDSPSELAQQMRGIILQQLKEGKSADEIKAYFVSKYGEWVLLAPPAKGFGLLVWVLPYAVAVAGIVLVFVAIRRWAGKKGPRRSSTADPSLIARVKREAAIEAPPPDPESGSSRAPLLQEQARLYAELRELDFDYRSGKLSETDYQALRNTLETEAALVLKQLEAEPPKQPAPAPKAPEARPRAEKQAAEMQKARRPMWQLAAGGAFLLLFGIAVGVFLTKSVRPRGSDQDSITGDFLTGTGPGGVAGGAGTAGMGAPSSKDVPALLAQGRAAYERQDWSKAIVAFKNALAVEPNHPEAHAYMGLILAQAGHADGALLAFDRALAANPKFSLALWGKGMLLYQAKQDFSGARQTLQSLLEILPAGEEKNQIQKTLVEINEASKGRKEGPKKTKAEAAAPPAARPAAQPQGQQIRGTITVDSKLKSKLDGKAVLFIVVYQAGSTGGPPLAVKKIDQPVFPLAYSLGSESVMMAGMPFSGKVMVSVRLDKDGNAMTKGPGDLTGEYKKNPAAVGSQNVDIVLDRAM